MQESYELLTLNLLFCIEKIFYMRLNEDLFYMLALQHAQNIGNIKAKKLIAHCGSAKAVFEESKQNLMRVSGIGTAIVRELSDKMNFKAAEQELYFISEHNVSCSVYTDVQYPKLLKQCVDGPILLFHFGNIEINEQPMISIVGARQVTQRGKLFCEQLLEAIAIFNPIIVSGFAYGTDITAQKAAMANGLQTIGCLAHGLDRIYPEAHRRYVNDIEQHGGFITDFWSSDPFRKINFVKRNRIIAGMSEATVVIESAERGGSLITADLARSYDRDVFAVPGRVSDPQSVGCNNLIKHHKAYMLSDPMDIPYMLNWDIEKIQSSQAEAQIPHDLEPEQQGIYNCIKRNTKITIDNIALECDIPVSKLAGLLLEMELKGLIRSRPGKQFELNQ